MNWLKFEVSAFVPKYTKVKKIVDKPKNSFLLAA